MIGLAGPSVTRPRLWHKSKSTTSITKSSVISSYQPQKSPTISDSASTGPTTTTAAPVRKPTAITIVTPQSPCTLSSTVMDWDRGSLPNSNMYINKMTTENEDSSSIISSNSSSTTSTSTADSSISINNSAAVDALVIASLIPTKISPANNNNFDDMPTVILSDRKQETEVVLTEHIAELVIFIKKNRRSQGISPKVLIAYN